MQISSTVSPKVSVDSQSVSTAQTNEQQKTVQTQSVQQQTDSVTISPEAAALLKAEEDSGGSSLNTGGTGIEPPAPEPTTFTGGTGIEPPTLNTGGTGIEPPSSGG